MAIDLLKRDFPKFKNIPEAFQKVYDKADILGGLLVGDYSMAEFLLNALLAWFEEKAAIAKELVIFGCDGNDGLYGYWTHGDTPLEKAPIIFLDDAGMRSTVLANTFEEFLALLGLGKNAIGRHYNWPDQKRPVEDVADYRTWLRDEMKIEPVTDEKAALAIIEKARGSHPDFNAWIDDWMAKH
jgi:hypothetical protein